jgi:hypothetical protein
MSLYVFKQLMENPQNQGALSLGLKKRYDSPAATADASSVSYSAVDFEVLLVDGKPLTIDLINNYRLTAQDLAGFAMKQMLKEKSLLPTTLQHSNYRTTRCVVTVKENTREVEILVGVASPLLAHHLCR